MRLRRDHDWNADHAARAQGLRGARSSDGDADGEHEAGDATADIHGRLIHPPRAADRTRNAIPAPLGRVTLDPAQNDARRDGFPALRHRGEISVRQPPAEIPTHAPYDHLRIEMAPREYLVETRYFSHRGRYSRGIVEHLPRCGLTASLNACATATSLTAVPRRSRRRGQR